MTTAILAADYYPALKTRAAQLEVCNIVDGRRVPVSAHTVADKRAARKLAAELGAKPWNF